MKILALKKVNIYYKGQQVVKDSSFTVEAGEIVGIVGPSGIGKTSILKAVMGILEPGSRVTGSINYKGSNLLTMTNEERRLLAGAELGLIFQDAGSSFCPVRTLGSQIYEAVSSHEEIAYEDFLHRADALFKRLGLQEGKALLKAYIHQLSGGMKQRVGIAAAMLLKPQVLLADEPTSALDTLTQRQVVEELQLVRKSFGTAIVLVSHNRSLVKAIADKVLVMDQGCLKEEA